MDTKYTRFYSRKPPNDYVEMYGYRPTEIGCLGAVARDGELTHVEKLVY